MSKNNHLSKVGINENVSLIFGNAKIDNCVIDAVRFTDSKVRYDVLIPMSESEEEYYTLVENVDSVCISSKQEQLKTNLN